MINYKYLLSAFPLMLNPLFLSPVVAQTDIPDTSIEEIIVTGSHIKRTNQKTPNPLSVFDLADYQRSGAPSITDIIDNTVIQSGSINRSDQFSYGGDVTGVKTINLRGLGLGRTLTLFNGKRMINSAAITTIGEMPVDIGNFPLIAMQRVEILKNGGATAYGSDAIAGVWNYITRDDFVGLEMRGSHTALKGSDGDHELAAIWGVESGAINWVTSIEWTKKNRLANPEINQVDYNSAPADGGWPLGMSSFGNPGTFFANDFSSATPDPACGTSVEHDFGAAGSYLIPNPLGVSFGEACGFSYMNFSNIIDPQSRLKVFSQIKVQLSNNLELYGEFIYANLRTTYYTSPTFPPTNPAAGYFTSIPSDNPGFQDMLTGLSTDEQATFAGGALWWGRPVAIAGPPLTGPRDHNTWRILGGARGKLPFADNIEYDISASYGTSELEVSSSDVLTERFDLAVNGLGGANCARASSAPSDPANTALRGDVTAGCYFYNVAGSHLTAEPGSVLANSPELIDWLFGTVSYSADTKLLVGDALLSGDLPIALKGGNIEWAFGTQYRQWKTTFQPTGDNRVALGADSFASPLHFQGVDFASATETETWATFAEVSLPMTSSITIDLGARREDYNQGTVIKPKVAGTYDILDKLTLRASFENSFRSPALGGEPSQTLTFYDPVGEYIPVVTPVPENIKPEQASNWSIGAIFAPTSGLTASIDYYAIKLKGPLSIESSTCACAEKVTDGSGTVISLITELINGAPLTTSGIDFMVDYQYASSFAAYSIGLNGNWVEKYNIEGNIETGGIYEAAGKYNFRSAASPVIVRSIPKLKLNAYIAMEKNDHSFTSIMHYTSGYDVDPSSTMFGVAGLESIKSHMTVDLNYSYTLMEKSKLSLSIKNILGNKAPLAPHELGYDSAVHNPLGRIWRIAVQHSF